MEKWFDESKFRRGQQDCYDALLEAIRNFELTSTGILPTRYGKSDVLRALAISLYLDNIIGCTFFLSPGLILRNQIVSIQQKNKMINIYGARKEYLNRLRVLRGQELDPTANDEIGLSTTIQFFQQNQKYFKDLIDHIWYITNKPVVGMIDECQYYSIKNEWGNIVPSCTATGHMFFILVTALAYRTDHEFIPGFEVEELNRTNVRKYDVRDKGDGIHNLIDVYEGVKKLIRLKANYEGTSFRDAWNENIICHLTREKIDINCARFLKEEDRELENKKLSELSKTIVRKVLTKAICDEEVIEIGVRLALKRLVIYRRILKNAAIIVFTGNDYDEMLNKNAYKVREAIEKVQNDYNLELDCVIATIKEEKAKNRIEKFMHDKHPIGDVLIVKQMAGIGIDCDRMKIVLDLSSVRTPGTVIQRLMRVATPISKILVAHVITLADCLMEAIWETFVKNEGGENGYISEDWEYLETYETIKKRKEDDYWSIQEAYLGGYDDSYGDIGDMDNKQEVEKWIEVFPKLQKAYTDVQISKGLREIKGGVIIKSEDDITNRISRLSIKCNRLVREITMIKLKGNYNKNQYGKITRNIWNEIKRDLGINTKAELNQITDIKILDKLVAKLERLKAIEIK